MKEADVAGTPQQNVTPETVMFKEPFVVLMPQVFQAARGTA